MKIWFRKLNDIAIKSLTPKARSFDVFTTETFELMVAISSGIKINWSNFLYDIIVVIVSIPDKQYRGFVVPIYRLLERCKVQMGHSSALHIHKMINKKSIATYKAKNIITKEYLLKVKKEIVEAKKKKSPRKAQVKKKLGG